MMKRRTTIPGSRWLAVVAASALALQVMAEAPSLQGLDSDSVESREQTCAALRNWAGNSPDKLLLMIGPEVSAQQRDSLIRIAKEVFNNSPRGALGVSFGIGQFLQNEVLEEGIPIAAPLPNFDSSRVLKSGDVLRAIDGVRIRTGDQCRIETMSRDQGQLVQVDIERDGRPMRVSLRLGSREELRQVGRDPLPPTMFEAAWKERLARITKALPHEAAACELPAQAWADGDRLSKEPPDPEAAIRKLGETQPASTNNAGTRPTLRRVEVPDADIVATGAPRARVGATVAQVSLLAGGGGVAQDLQAANREAVRQRIAEIREVTQQVVDRIEKFRRLVEDPQTPRETRQMARQELDGLEVQLLELQLEGRSLQQLLRQR